MRQKSKAETGSKRSSSQSDTDKNELALSVRIVDWTLSELVALKQQLTDGHTESAQAALNKTISDLDGFLSEIRTTPGTVDS